MQTDDSNRDRLESAKAKAQFSEPEMSQTESTANRPKAATPAPADMIRTTTAINPEPVTIPAAREIRQITGDVPKQAPAENESRDLSAKKNRETTNTDDQPSQASKPTVSALAKGETDN